MNLTVHCLGETNNETSITSNQPQNKSKINNNNRKELINSILEAAIAKTIAEEKESTREESSGPLLGEKEKVEERNEIPKVKNIGFVNRK